jgi:hypothetical protein
LLRHTYDGSDRRNVTVPEQEWIVEIDLLADPARLP